MKSLHAQQATRSIVFLGLSLAISFVAAEGQTYSLSGLGFAGTISGVHQPLGISNSGQVVGFDDSKGQAFLWSAGVVSQLCNLLQNPSQASAISHNGLYAATGSPNQGVLIQWDQPRRYCDWMAFGGQNYASTAVNDVPDIVGTIAGYRAYFATFDTTGILVFTVLGTFGGSTVPSGINNSAEIAGYSVNAGGYVRAFYVNGGPTLRDFDPNATAYDSAAYALNDSGVVVGSSNKGGPCPKGPNNCRGRYTYPVILTTAPITKLPSLGGSQGTALAINNSNVIVGWSTTSTQARHAFRYSGGQMIDLNSAVILNGAGWLLTEASAINDSGVIAGHGTNPAGQDEIFVLTPQ